MRIQCPKCRLAYDLPAGAIPDPGREVQCSACGHAWFLLHGATRPDPINAGHEQAARTATSRPDTDGDDPSDAEADHDTGTSEDSPPPPRRKIDPDVLAILQEEASVEAKARETEALRAQPGPKADEGGGAHALHTPDADTAEWTPEQVDHERAALFPSDWAAGPRHGPTSDRLARLAAAERAYPPPHEDETDDGLVEDPFAAWRDPPPPALSAPSKAPAAKAVRRDLTLSQLPPHVLEQRHRTGFRLGFASTAGTCCAALGLYLLAVEYGTAALPFADQLLDHGARAQTAVAQFVRGFFAG